VNIELAEVRPAAVVADLRSSIDDLAARAGVKLQVKVRRDLTAVIADRQRLREIILNLVDNAVKYTPPGGRVVLAATNGDGRVEVSVTDTGVGIPDGVGDRIFEPFYRVKGNRTQRSEASSGLGLALTRRLVEAQGGTISFEPRPGGGTIFRFTVPAAG
jgi:signal transduction histidine kinase